MHTSSKIASPERRRLAAILSLLLLLAYPFAVHFGALAGQPLPALLILVALLLLPPSLAGQWQTALAGLGFLLLLALLWWLTALHTVQLFYLPPLAILLLLWWWFARSLLPGQTALVSRLALPMHGGKLSPVLQRYTRAVTWVWVGVLSLLLLQLYWLTRYAPPEYWSLFANFLNYLILAAVFVIEFSLRRFFLPPEHRIDMASFLRMLSRLRLHDLR